MQKQLTILDCTLRDGGYYNNWDFDRELVSFYLSAMGNARVDAIEIGFRSLDAQGMQGAFATSTDEFLAALPLPANTLTGVMINAKEFINSSKGSEGAVQSVFKKASQSPVKLVRVAAHFAELPQCSEIVKTLAALGYRVGFNLMQSAGRTDLELTQAAQLVASWKNVEVLYFADSLGSLDGKELTQITRALRAGWPGPIGFHAHDNKGQALANCLTAIEAGITWLDGTVLGMGRGAGNVRTEHLLLELQQKKQGNYFAEALFPIVLEHFEELHQKYGWGTSLLYYLSALHGIHPTYIQELLDHKGLEPHHLMGAIDFLKKIGGKSYSKDSLKTAILSPQGKTNTGSWDVTAWAKNRDFLVIAPGPGTSQNLPALLEFIDKKNPVVVALNANDAFPWEKVTAYAACHQARLLLDSDKLCHLKKPLIAPQGMIPDIIRDKLKAVEILDYGMQVKKDTFEAGATSCTLPSSLVAAYVLALAVASNASRILLAGFDGFGESDPRQKEMETVLACYKKDPRQVPLVAVTKTSYSVPETSLKSL